MAAGTYGGRVRRALRRRRIITGESHIIELGDRCALKSAQREVIRVGRFVVPVSRWQWFEQFDWPLR